MRRLTGCGTHVLLITAEDAKRTCGAPPSFYCHAGGPVRYVHRLFYGNKASGQCADAFLVHREFACLRSGVAIESLQWTPMILAAAGAMHAAGGTAPCT